MVSEAKALDGAMSIQEVGGGTASAQGDISGAININLATVDELDQGLPGIGKVLAQRIVDYRQQNGPFRSIEEITSVSGIGDAKFGQIKDLISVN
ncbi:MAG: ComEA family DNA-binding protein [Bacillota bacterium]